MCSLHGELLIQDVWPYFHSLHGIGTRFQSQCNTKLEMLFWVHGTVNTLYASCCSGGGGRALFKAQLLCGRGVWHNLVALLSARLSHLRKRGFSRLSSHVSDMHAEPNRDMEGWFCCVMGVH